MWPNSPICNRLRLSLDSWRKITSNKTILAWIEFGVSYEFVDGPPPPTSGIEYNISEELAAVRDEEFRRYLELGAIEPLPQDQLASATFNGVFVVSQRNKDRPVIDPRYPNSYQKKIHFKMDTIRDVKDLLREGDFMFKRTSTLCTDAHTESTELSGGTVLLGPLE